jgi:hypothetical protein
MLLGDPNFNVVLIVALSLFFLLAIPILIGTWIYRNAQKRREAELIRLAIEKGQTPPNFPASPVSRYGTFKTALIWIGGAIGWILMVVFGELLDWSGVSLGFIPLFIGIAMLIGWIVEKSANGRS